MFEFAPRPGHSDEVVFGHDRATGRIRLNRPEVINALNPAMISAISAQLADWSADPEVANVIIDGAGDRGLCAGGDIKALHQAVLEDNRDAQQFWVDEYAMNATIANFRKPTVSLMDGVVMGGGIGVAGYCALRVVTERSKIAMPEVIIGFFPDVGTRFLLSRSAHEIGTHLALTGATVGAADAIAAGLADVVMTDAEITELIEHLAQGGSLKHAPGTVPASPLAGQAWISECYRGDSAVEIVARLGEHDDPEAQATAHAIRQRCPLSVAVTLAGLRRAEEMTLVEVLDQDAILARRFAASPDFLEGVRAQLIDRDRQPRWQHQSLGDVTPDEVNSYFTASASV